MLIQQVESAIHRLRPTLLAQSSDINFLSATELGVVRVSLSGDCCTDSLKKLVTLLDVEKALKAQVQGLKIVINDQ